MTGGRWLSLDHIIALMMSFFDGTRTLLIWIERWPAYYVRPSVDDVSVCGGGVCECVSLQRSPHSLQVIESESDQMSLIWCVR